MGSDRAGHSGANVHFNASRKTSGHHRGTLVERRSFLACALWRFPSARSSSGPMLARTAEMFRAERFPVFNLQVSHDDAGRYYGFPDHEGAGFKIGKYHHRRQQGAPEELSHQADQEDEQILRDAVRRFFPKAAGATKAMQTCLFTNTPDEHFILDRLLAEAPVAVAAGFSGHGFKFCSVVGEIMADLITGQAPPFDLSEFRLNRF